MLANASNALKAKKMKVFKLYLKESTEDHLASIPDGQAG